MKVLILGGFLGSGKTTVLIQMAGHLVNKAGRDDPSIQVPVVILENEVSTAGIDNRLLSRSGFQVREMLSGCICCSSSARLIDAVKDIKETYRPRWLIIEATGMAYPDAICETLHGELQIDAKVLALVDASRWMRLIKAMPQFARSQLMCADVILINKTDLASREQTLQIRESLEQMNASACIQDVSMLHVQDDGFWEDIMKRLEAGHA